MVLSVVSHRLVFDMSAANDSDDSDDDIIIGTSRTSSSLNSSSRALKSGKEPILYNCCNGKRQDRAVLTVRNNRIGRFYKLMSHSRTYLV